MSEPKTIRVRIPVRVTSEGEWAAYGYRNATSDMTDEVLVDMIDANYSRLFYVEATLPIPSPATVEGRVGE